MPSHGPTEPPDEDHGWSEMYEKIVGSEVGKALLEDLVESMVREALLKDLYRWGGDWRIQFVSDYDGALQAFVQHVYDLGMAHGYGQAQEDQGQAALAEELERTRR